MNWHTVLDVIALLCLVGGSLMSLAAAVGLVRFPDLLSRMHAGTKPQVLGLLLLATFLAVPFAALGAALRDPARLRRSRDLRAAQLDVLTALARATPGPLILGGDLNTPPRGPAYRALRQAVGPDTFQRAGRGPGWTYPGLRLRIDHQFSRGLRPSRARVLPWTLSDHRLLLVEYRP